jgi:tetratricopeptide (TPR) repeat protein
MKLHRHSRLTLILPGVLASLLLFGWPDPAASQAPAGGAAPSAKSEVPSVEQAKSLVRQNANDPNAYVTLGAAYRRIKQYDDALTAFKKAASLAPGSSTPHVSLGAVYMDMGRLKDAEKEFKKAVQLNPKDGFAHYNLGNYYAAIGRQDDALGSLRRATEVTPEFADAWVNYGIILNQVGKAAEAKQAYEKALAQDSTNVRAINNMGNAEYALGRTSNATALYKNALKIDPNNQEAFYNLGVSFADAQIYKQALDYWQRVVSIDSTTVIAQSAKNSIQVLTEFLSQQEAAPPGQSQVPAPPGQ